MIDHEISRLQKQDLQRNASDFSNFGDDYLFARFTTQPAEGILSGIPTRVPGLAIILLLQGRMTVDVNLVAYDMQPDSVLLLGPGSLFQPRHIDDGDFDTCLFFVSHEFMRDINLDINTLNSRGVSENHSPLMQLTPAEMSLLRRYFALVHENTRSNTDAVFIRSIARSVIAGAFYQLMQFGKRREVVDDSAAERPSTRRHNYVKEFMQLVREYHRSERSISFYASKLFISPKYLSIVVREATGRPASAWIDDYVILEAKNLLRFSGKNVQQIAYELNFTNQSSFGKYFKHLTGMSPTQFQRS
ncbi:MAG: helix-turn-helix domain-containing protein [Paramuribaculum sp.]|nr:helix-turn-helix domain-containing protein [Paramuribaculum sp.]MDE5722764.1 helix-turn-helix domain-containing protein [Paramuribaculum sp.]